jgi:hypothetical protein
LSIAALPYTVFLLVTEFAVGAQLCLLALDLRNTVTRGFIKLSAGLVAAAVALTFWVALAVPSAGSLAGYRLAPAFLTPARALLALFLLLALAELVATLVGERRTELALVAAASAAAVAALACATAMVQPPTWSEAGAFFSLLAGGLALGGVTLAMVLGHWYLVTPRLPEQPLNEMTGALLGIFAVQTLLLVINVLAPARWHGNPLGIGLGQNPAFWLRVGVGLVLAALLTYMAWQSSRARGMMSATGLLYLATGAVLAGEALACALLFTTAIPG